VELDSLRREVAMLRNQVEIQENELDKLRKRQRELYDDLDYRLRARERVSGPAGPPAGAVPPLPTRPVAQTEPPPLRPVPETTETAAIGPGQAPSPGPGVSPVAPVSSPPEEQAPAAPTQVAVATAAEQAAYDAAFEMLKQGRYGEAIAAFENMIVQYPIGALADDSQYWIGEAWYVTRDFERALGVFKQLVGRYPDSPRVPEALLKIGYVQNEVGARTEACRTFTDVIARYPGSRVAISAQTRRKKLELEGHCPSS
jgi:tol-pal system protein YbgF